MNILTMGIFNAQNMKFSIKDFFNKCDQTRSFLRIWSHFVKKSLMENFIFCAVILRDMLRKDGLHLSQKRKYLNLKISPG